MSTKAFDPSAAAEKDSGIYGLKNTIDSARVVVIPVPFDATTSYGKGTANGPAEILQASHQVELFDFELGNPYEQGIVMLDHPTNVAEWNTDAIKYLEDRKKVNKYSLWMNRWVHKTAQGILAKGKIPIVIGGDHSTPYGAIKAYAEFYKRFGILHIDAHADLREAYEGYEWSHASIMWNVLRHIVGVEKIVQVGIRDLCEAETAIIGASENRVVAFYDRTLQRKRHEGNTWVNQAGTIVSQLPHLVYISFDIDGLDPRFCPHTGTPVPGGLDFDQVCTLFALVVESGRKIIGFDINEVAPGPEGDEWDGNVAARLLYKLIGWTLKSQEAKK